MLESGEEKQMGVFLSQCYTQQRKRRREKRKIFPAIQNFSVCEEIFPSKVRRRLAEKRSDERLPPAWPKFSSTDRFTPSKWHKSLNSILNPWVCGSKKWHRIFTLRTFQHPFAFPLRPRPSRHPLLSAFQPQFTNSSINLTKWLKSSID